MSPKLYDIDLDDTVDTIAHPLGAAKGRSKFKSAGKATINNQQKASGNVRPGFLSAQAGNAKMAKLLDYKAELEFHKGLIKLTACKYR